MIRKIFALFLLTLNAIAVSAADDVTVSLSGNVTTMSNGIVSIKIGSNGRVSEMKYNNGSNLLASSGIYFDYTVGANTAYSSAPSGNLSLNPSTAQIVKKSADYAEVLYSNTSDSLRFKQGFIMRKGVSGVYTYVVLNGTTKSANTPLKEARVCTRLASNFLNGYVDDRMRGTIPSNSEMAAVEGNPVQDATYQMADGSIYTKYNWAQYVVRDSVHGLMNSNTGVWNIACSHEWLNGGPMRQELTVHATSKSPITIQMMQGEHLGGATQYYKVGECKVHGPFLIYVNSGTQEQMVADAKRMAHEQEQQWPFEWFSYTFNSKEQYQAQDRATVKGRLNVTTGQPCDSVQVLLADPGSDPMTQGKNYMYWALTDKDGNFEIKNVRKGSYMLYGWATKGNVTDELQKADITVDANEVNLGTIDWTPACHETLVWQIGENNRLSDGFRYSDTLRNYGLWELPPASLTYIIGQSKEAEDWYFAQTKSGTWTVQFELDEKPASTTRCYLTASVACATYSPKVAVKVNGTTRTNWTFPINDSAITRSAVNSGRHWLQTCEFLGSYLKKGANTIGFTMSVGNKAGLMWDCIKLEMGPQVANGIAQVGTEAQAPEGIYTLDGLKVEADGALRPGIYIVRSGNKTKKVLIQ